MRIGTLAALLLACWMHAQTDVPSRPRVGQRPRIEFADLQRQFASPSMIYAPFAFWFWDAKLDPAHAARMAEEMARQGLNPGYAHPRHGLPHEEWLDERWFETFGAALAKAREHDAYLGYCDEYWWPSGQADGRVLAAHPELAAVSLDCRTFDVRKGSTVDCPASYLTTAVRLVEPLANDAPRPRFGEWIWCPGAEGAGQTARFRLLVDLEDRPPEQARLAITADNQFRLWVNGDVVAEGTDWARPVDVDLAPRLQAGRNVLAIEARNDEGPCGLLFGLRVVAADGTRRDFVSGEDVSAAAATMDGWMKPEFDDSSWHRPVTLGSHDAAPWHLASPSDRRVPRVIESKTARRIGGGDAFQWTAEDGDWRVYSFVKVHRRGVDGGAVNYLDRRLAPAFLAIAHAPWEKALGKELGRGIPGVFVDHEGDYGAKLAWSEDLERDHLQRTGVPLDARLPLLLDRDVEGVWPKARYDWYRSVSSLYAEGFFGVVNDWLAARGMHCISNLWEESLAGQAWAVGDFFAVQRRVTMPGTDCLVKKPLEVHDFKETQSVSEFENRRFQSEVLGVAGWEMSPVLMKRAANAVTAWGVSHIVPHGVNLNRELNTIPYPPDWFTSNPYWPWMHLWTDFCRRASFVNSCGHAVPEVLLLNPMDGVWALLGGRVFDPTEPVSLSDLFASNVSTGEDGLSIAEIESSYRGAMEALNAARVQFLITDDHYLRQMRITDDGRLERGPLSFQTLVLPNLFILPCDVMERIVAFAAAGGAVVVLGDLPRGSTDRGLNDPRMTELVSRLTVQPSVRRANDGLAQPSSLAVLGLRPRVDFVHGSFPLLHLHRRIDGRDFHWLVNESGDRVDCELSFRGAAGAASRWDCETGAIEALASTAATDASRVKLAFDPYQAYWVVFDSAHSPIAESPPPTPRIQRRQLEGKWKLNFMDVEQPPAPVSGPGPGSVASLEFLTDADIERDLADWSSWRFEGFSGYLSYTKSFVVDGEPQRVLIDLGQVLHVAEVRVNGRLVGRRAWPPFTFDVTEFVRAGDNELTVRVGNLLINSMQRFGPSGWTRPTAEDFRSGLIGPVAVETHDQGN